VAVNEIGGSTLATIADSDIDTTVGAVTVSARSDAGIQAFALSASIAAGGAGTVSVQVAASGVVALNTMTNSIEASIILDSDIDATGDVSVLAEDYSNILAALGSASIAAGGAGGVSVNVSVAATYAENTIGGSMLATIDDSDVDTSGAVIVDAFADASIDAFGLAVGISAGGAGTVSVNVALSVVAATNLIAGSVEASIIGSTLGAVTEPGDVTVSARNVSDIFAVLASASVAAGGAG